ncbi:MAG: PEP-utilizing enzyme [Terrimesophilobacter sp.]
MFGHRFYQNVSVLSEMAAGLPGQMPEDFDHQINGEPYPDDYLRPKLAVSDVAGYLKFAAGAEPRLLGLGKAVEGVEERAQASCWAADSLTVTTDEALHARIETLWDQCVDGWRVGLLCTFLVTAPVAVLERRYGVDAVTRPHRHDTSLASSLLLLGVQQLSRKAKRSPKAAALLAGAIDSTSWAELQRSDPEYASEVRTLLTVAGHRGPGETELASDVYADAPWLLLRAISGAADREPPPPGRPDSPDAIGRLLTKASWSAIGRRERCRDAVMVLTHQLRTALREWGSRLAARSWLADADDVFYLTYDELCGGEPDLAGKVTRRRTERTRLAELDLPCRFRQPMDLSRQVDPAQFDRVIVGVPAVAGVAVGRVRVLRSPDDELEPGEVLVTRVTDTGWTPFFGTASAVVTDIGGAMSHASIVARGFGIPAVVGTEHASLRLVDGQLVEVNGHEGTVTLLD